MARTPLPDSVGRRLEPILTIRGLTKSFGARAVLRGVDLDVFPGDVVSIIGASGSGKTTLLRCIDLLEDYQGGEIRLDGELLGFAVSGDRRRRLSGRALARQRARIGMVFQSYNLFPHLTAAPERHARPDQGAADFRRTRRGRSPSAGSTASASPRTATIIPRRFPAGSSSASRSRGRSPWTRACCSSTR